MTSYQKPFLALPDQLERLKQRGLSVTDDARAIAYLERIGYYRLSGYWHPLRESRVGASGQPELTDRFRETAEFRQVVELYVFDKKLRLLMLDAIERVEVALRTQIALHLGAHDPWAHRNAGLLDGRFTRHRGGPSRHDLWLRRLDDSTGRSREDFVTHFNKTYPSSPLPIWVAIELWDFGMLSHFLDGMRYRHQRQIAMKYGINRPELLVSWVRAINFVRNVCAHHARLWNRPLVDQPKPPRIGEIPLLDHVASDRFAQARLYAVAVILRFLLQGVNPSTTWPTRLKELTRTFPTAPGIAFDRTGFPAGWDAMQLWD